MPPTPRNTRARRQETHSPSQIDPQLHSAGQSPQHHPHPYTLGSLAEAGASEDSRMEDPAGSPAPIADPLTDFARQVIESVVPHQDDGEEEDVDLFHPDGQEMGLEAAVRAAEEMEHDELQTDERGNSGEDQGLGPVAAPGTRRGRAAQGAASSASTTAAHKRKRNNLNGGLVAEESRDLARMKKDSHKEVERKRRDNINEGIMQIGRFVPGCSEKLGKGQILNLAAQYLSELTGKDGSSSSSAAKSNEPNIQKLQTDLAEAQAQLTDEHTRSITLETSWREAEDRAAASQFELERVKKELEDAKMALLENRR